MKRIIPNNLYLIMLLQFILLTSCISSQSFLPVKGSGMSIDKNISVSDFHSIEVSGGFDVILVQGNSEDLTITAQENLFEYITAKVDQGILKIYTEDNVMATNPLKARIPFKSISNLKVSGGGDVICETTIDVPNLVVHMSGGGDFNTMINTDELKCHISGGGDAKIDGSIKNYNLNLTGGGDIKSAIDANIIFCDVSGGGDVNLTGQASNLEINVTGGGDFNAGNFSANIISFHVSGGSDIHVNVSKELTGNISGGGDVYYSGSPENVTIDARGGSEVHKQ